MVLRNVRPSFSLSFSRSGGALVIARVDVWKPTTPEWQLIQSFLFNDSTLPKEVLPGELVAGSYTCVFQCFVQEAVNGVFQFAFAVDAEPTYEDGGDVNTTSAPNDSKTYHDEFVLNVG